MNKISFKINIRKNNININILILLDYIYLTVFNEYNIL